MYKGWINLLMYIAFAQCVFIILLTIFQCDVYPCGACECFLFKLEYDLKASSSLHCRDYLYPEYNRLSTIYRVKHNYIHTRMGFLKKKKENKNGIRTNSIHPNPIGLIILNVTLITTDLFTPLPCATLILLLLPASIIRQWQMFSWYIKWFVLNKIYNVCRWID